MSQRELAELLRVSERSMQAYESGEVIPYRHLRELERILGRPMAWFLYGDEALQAPAQTTLDDVFEAVRAVQGELKMLRDDVEKLNRGAS